LTHQKKCVCYCVCFPLAIPSPLVQTCSR
jgi:hypothetical protein